MRLSNFTYLFKEGARNVLHNKLMSLASIGVLVACLLLIGGAALFSLNVNSIVRYVEQQNEVLVYLSDNLTAAQIQGMEMSLRGTDNVLETTFVSRGQALENKKNDVGEEFAGLFDGLEEDNPLLDSYVVRIEDPSVIEQTVRRLQEIDGVYKVNAATDVAKILSGLNKTVTAAGASVVLILVAVSVVIITNTIKLTVFSRRKEINIMKYVGATDTFIRLPFLVEGVLIGLLAASLAFLMLGFGYTYLLGMVESHYLDSLVLLYNNAVDFWDIAHYMFAGFAGLGVFIGVSGSGFFVRKYLRV